MDSEREEKLRAAKEKLKKFQARRKSGATPTPPPPQGPTEVDTPTPVDYFSLAALEPPTGVEPDQGGHIADYFGQTTSSEPWLQPAPVAMFGQVGGVVVSQDPEAEIALSGAPLPTASDSVAVIEPEDESTASVGSLAPSFSPPTQPAIDLDSGLSLSEQIRNVLATTQPDDPAEAAGPNLAQVEAQNQALSQQVEHLDTSLKQYETYCQTLNEQLQSCQQEMALVKAEQMTSLQDETQRYQEELQAYKDSISMLVADKSDFQTQLKQQENGLRMKEVEVTSLKQLLLESERRTQDHVGQAQAVQRSERDEEELRELQSTVERLSAEIIEKNEDQRYLQSRLGAKDQETSAQGQELSALKSKLELAELNLVQLRSATSSADNVEIIQAKDETIQKLQTENEKLVKREAELSAYIQQASQDREQIIHQYTNYSQQLATQIESITQHLNEKIQENAKLAQNEEDLTAHIGGLEAQLQQMIQTNREKDHGRKSEEHSAQHQALPTNVTQQEIEMLRKKVLSLDERLSEVIRARDDLQGQTQQQNVEIHTLQLDNAQKLSAISDLQTQNEMLKDGNQSSMNHSDLMAACESDKVAASRAMTQNKLLKEQNEELQTALVEMTNAKAELMDEVDTLRRRLSALMKDDKICELVSQVTELSAAVDERDRAVEGLKSKMQQYVAFAENSIHGRLDAGEDVYEGEEDGNDLSVPSEPAAAQKGTNLEVTLQNAQEQIRALDVQNADLKRQLDGLSRHDHRSSPSSMSESSATSTNSSSMGSSAVMVNTIKPSMSASSSPVMLEAPNGHHPLPNEPPQIVTNEAEPVVQAGHVPPVAAKNPRPETSAPVISRDVAMVKLEQKFKAAMTQIADLLAEKDQLEHVNIQLQEETETVGEYITIYQYQRQQIKRRMDEKEEQLQQVSREREELKAKLAKLHGLVTHHLSESQKQNPHLTQVVVQEPNQQRPQPHEPSTHHIDDVKKTPTLPVEMAQEMTEHSHGAEAQSHAASSHSVVGKGKSGTAQQILDLLSEIEGNQILDTNFHPYFFWDPSHSSGRLQTV